MFNVFSPPGLPGFRVRPQDDVPGFDIDGNGLPRRERTWSDAVRPRSATPQYPDAAQALTPTPSPEDLAQPALPQPPEWPYKLLTLPLAALSGPLASPGGPRPAPYGTPFNPLGSYPTTDQHVREMGDARADAAEITPPPALAPALSAVEGPSTEQWPSFDAPKPLADIDENGLPRRERTWSDGMRPGSAQQMTPVNCTTANGSMGLYVTGRSIVQRRESLPRFP